MSGSRSFPPLALQLPQVDGGDGSASPSGAGAGEFVDPACIFPLLPYGFTPNVDLRGWMVTVGTRGSGSIERVFDHCAQTEVVALTANPTDPLASRPTPAPLGQTGPPITNDATTSYNGTHRVRESVTVQGNTGANSALETSLTQRLHGLDIGAKARLRNNGPAFDDRTSEVNTRGDELQLHKNYPASPVANRRRSAQVRAQVSSTSFASASSALAASSATSTSNSPSRSAAVSGTRGLSHPSSTSTLLREAEAAALRKKASTRLTETSLEFPHPTQFIGTSLPIINLQLKHVEKYVSFEIEVEDTVGKLYRFEISNACTVVRLRLDSACLPLTLTPGWNRLALDLNHLTRTCFNAQYKQAHRIKIMASCRLRRVFFSDLEYPDFALPAFLRIFSDSFYKAKRAEEVEADAAIAAAAVGSDIDEDDETEEEEAKQQPARVTTITSPASRPSRLRDQLRAELDAARALESSLDSSRTLQFTAGASGGASFEHRLLSTQEARVLKRHEDTKASWSRFKNRAASSLQVAPDRLNISQSDLWRGKVEERDLLDKAVPPSEQKGGGEEVWAASLRDLGRTVVPQKMEFVRRPYQQHQ